MFMVQRRLQVFPYLPIYPLFLLAYIIILSARLGFQLILENHHQENYFLSTQCTHKHFPMWHRSICLCLKSTMSNTKRKWNAIHAVGLKTKGRLLIVQQLCKNFYMYGKSDFRLLQAIVCLQGSRRVVGPFHLVQRKQKLLHGFSLGNCDLASLNAMGWTISLSTTYLWASWWKEIHCKNTQG